MIGSTLPQAAARSTVGSLFRDRARLDPDRPAIETAGRTLTYRQVDERVNRVAEVLRGFGVERGDRVALLSENRPEYLELELACAKLGAILACQNWRLAPPELAHCIALVSPSLIVVSERHADLLSHARVTDIPVIRLGPEFDERLANAPDREPEIAAEPEDGLLILYTSGTTGLPKGAVISHRAELARYLVYYADLGLRPDDTSLGWPPFFRWPGSLPGEPALRESPIAQGLVVRFERGIRPRNLFRGDDRQGAEPPFEFPRRHPWRTSAPSGLTGSSASTGTASGNTGWSARASG